ncbi:probable RNA-binding protein 19 [Eriocheir sinensis]|uniref:probable RNA-binding protein 19 n=1 Tax=Eriocheir sinensis TaxID=95602 RepID=UPI0021C6CDCE|nr:probable RNA-binding protein 19 [Eriocheir sinensis]XP_050698873.1 probable RNA-binding protein 19 [Eriocheir sinensis]
MSRIVVKNLPKQISQEELKKHFSQKGSITDVRLIHKNGEFRRFAFIGFEDEGDAATARDYFHNTFIKQAKIAVEMCQELGQGQKPKSWAEKNKEKAQLRKATTNNNETETKEEGKKKKKKERKKEEDSLKAKLLSQYKDDPTFGEFLKANEKGAKEETSTPVVAKEEEEEEESSSEAEEEEEEEEELDDKLAQKKDISDQDYLKSLMKAAPQDKGHIEGTKPKKVKERKEFHTVVIRATEMCKAKQSNSRTFTKKSVKAFLKPLKFKSLRIPKNVRMVAYVGFKTEKEMKQALQKDKSFLDGVRVHIVKHERPSSGGDDSTQSSTPWSVKEEALKSAEPVAESGKLFVRNLWYSVTEELLQELFQKYGEVTDVTLPICKYTRRAKGFATVTFMFPEHAVKAMAELDGTSFKGRILHVLPAVEPKTENKQKENLSFKEKKAQEKKATAGSWHNWNTLFLGSGAVVDIMAERYSRSKQEILDSEGKQSVAVNLALGETQVVDETKRFLEDNGVSLEAFSSPGVQRSKTVFLVKNLPARTTAQELMELFCKFGELGRVILPPSGVTGIVEFLDSGEAKKAFRNLAYSRFKSLPLYLEWAPVQVFKAEFTAKTEKMEEGEAEDSKGEGIKGEEAPAASQQNPEPDTTVYVKNLNFSTTEEILKQHFERVGAISSVLIARRRGESQGYGFVQFLRRADAQKALREMNESTLEDHTLQIKLSEKTLVTTLKSARRMHDAGKQTSSKILVKNIPFQATPKEVRQLFVTFGELKSVRLPQKPGSTEHRGFGFVDFVSREDAKKAFEALGLSTHLYDRRLVLEWAKDEETVDELRKRTAEHFLGPGHARKRSKVQVEAKVKDDSDDD